MISIIVPIYNTADYLKVCLTSLVQQTERDLQIILVDDGSTDDSATIARDFAGHDTRIELIQQAHAGQSAARNQGLAHAKGKYIAFVDADDYLEPDWCAQHLAAIEGVDYVQSGYKRIKNEKITIDHSPRSQYLFTSPCMRLYKKEALKGLHFEEGMIYEDVIWSMDLWLSGATCRRISYTGYCYTVNPNSTTSRPHPEAQEKVIRMLKRRLKNTSAKGKCIVGYTIIRLKLHFLKQ